MILNKQVLLKYHMHHIFACSPFFIRYIIYIYIIYTIYHYIIFHLILLNAKFLSCEILYEYCSTVLLIVLLEDSNNPEFLS